MADVVWKKMDSLYPVLASTGGTEGLWITFEGPVRYPERQADDADLLVAHVHTRAGPLEGSFTTLVYRDELLVVRRLLESLWERFGPVQVTFD